MKIRKIIKPILAVTSTAVIVAPICACSKSVNVEEVKFNQEYSYVETGTTRDFSQEVKITPENASDKSLTWKISDESGNGHIATVDEKTGVVTGLVDGYAKLTCTSNSNSTKSSEQWIVVGKYVELTGFSIDKFADAHLKEKMTLTPKFVPEDATTAKGKYIKWESSDPSIATIDQETGEIDPVSRGGVTITATPYDYDYQTKTFVLKDSLKSTCYLTVDYAPIEEFYVKPQQMIVKNQAGTQFRVAPTIKPAGANQEYDVAISPSGIVHLVDEATDKTTFAVDQTFVDQPQNCNIFFTSKYDPTRVIHCAITVENFVPVEKIQITPPAGALPMGTDWEPTVTLTPTIPTERNYYFESSNTDVAVVSTEDSHKIRPVAAGYSTITVYSCDGIHKDSCEIQITPQAVPVQSVWLPATATVQKTQSIKLDAVILPFEATDKRINWKTSDITKARVIDGVVIGEGITDPETPVIITAESMSDYTKFAECKVTVTEEPITPISSINIQQTAYVKGKETDTITAYDVLPEDATNKTLSWTVADTNVADIIIDPADRTKIKVFGKKPGHETEVYALAIDGSGVVSNPCHVKVGYDDPTNVIIAPRLESMFVGDEVKLLPVVLPDTAKKDVIWESSDPETASISSSGVVVAKREGEVKITCRHAEHTSLFDFITIKVKRTPKHVTKIIMTKDSIEAKCGHPSALPVLQYEPQDTTEKEVTWSVGDPTIATVDTENNTIVAHKEGVTTLTATSIYDTSLKASCQVVVPKPEPERVSIVSGPEVLDVNQTGTVTAKIYPLEAPQELEFESLNPEVLKVVSSTSTTCDVCGVSGGTTAVRCKAKSNPSVYYDRTINVFGHTSFVNDSWETVCEYASKGLDALHKHYSLDCEMNKDFPGTLIGYQKTIHLHTNKVAYQVRVIGENHDEKTDGKKASLTFELMNVYCDENNKAVETKWEPDQDDDTRYTTRSHLFPDIDGEASGRGSKSISKTCIKALEEGQNDLFTKLAKVKKSVYETDSSWAKLNWHLVNFECRLFPLTANEINSSTYYAEGSPYEFYAKYPGANEVKAKKDLNGKRYDYWLMSPKQDEISRIRCIDMHGDIYAYIKDQYQYISFAFCI